MKERKKERKKERGKRKKMKETDQLFPLVNNVTEMNVPRGL